MGADRVAKPPLMEILHEQVKNRSIEPTRIVDHYVAGADGVARMKLRDLRHEGKGGQSLLVIKEPIADESAGHWLKTTIVLSGNQSMAIRSGSYDYAPNLVVFKDRYKMDLAGHAAHIYVYLSDLRGLVTVSFKGLPNAKARADLRSSCRAVMLLASWLSCVSTRKSMGQISTAADWLANATRTSSSCYRVSAIRGWIRLSSDCVPSKSPRLALTGGPPGAAFALSLGMLLSLITDLAQGDFS